MKKRYNNEQIGTDLDLLYCPMQLHWECVDFDNKDSTLGEKGMFAGRIRNTDWDPDTSLMVLKFHEGVVFNFDLKAYSIHAVPLKP